MMLEELFWKEGTGCFVGRPIILTFWHPKRILTKETHRWIPLWVKRLRKITNRIRTNIKLLSL